LAISVISVQKEWTTPDMGKNMAGSSGYAGKGCVWIT
jgi:hypothetical protein